MELIDRFGINHIDVAASYGEAEDRLGPWLEQHRDRYFLATKTGERSRDEAWAEINRSLERLRTDHVDLIQLHNLVDEVGMAAGVRVRRRARGGRPGPRRGAGPLHRGDRSRAHGGHPASPCAGGVRLRLGAAAVQLSDGAERSQYLAEFDELAAVCAERGVAVQTIKAITRAPWGDREQTANTWYEPLRDPDAIDTAVSWVLGRDGVFLNTVGDITILPMVLEAADDFTGRPDEDAMRRLEETWQLEPLFV